MLVGTETGKGSRERQWNEAGCQPTGASDRESLGCPGLWVDFDLPWHNIAGGLGSAWGQLPGMAGARVQFVRDGVLQACK